MGKSTNHSSLTKREAEVLKFVAEGYSNRKIADRLLVSMRTIESHRARVMIKLRLSTVPELVKFAIKEGLTSVEGNHPL